MPTFAKLDDASDQDRSTEPPGNSTTLHTTADRQLERLTRTAQRLTGTDSSAILLVEGDHQWIAASAGHVFPDTPRTLSFFYHALQRTPILVEDTLADPRMRHHPLVAQAPGIRMYAASPLLAEDGTLLGAFYLFDHRPQALCAMHRTCLDELAGVTASAVQQSRALASMTARNTTLMEKERRMLLAIEGSGTGIWDRNVAADEIHYSRSWKALLGYREHELTNRLMDSYLRVHPDDIDYVRATIQAHFEQKTESYEVEHRLRCKDGSYIWVSSRGKVVSRTPDGKPLRMVGTTQDITAMRTISERLRQSAKLLSDLSSEVPGLMFQRQQRADGTAHYSYVSAGIADMYELDPEEDNTIAPEAIHARIHPDDLQTYLTSFETSATQQKPWQLEYRVMLPRQGLRWRYGHARPQRLEDGTTVWHGLITDATERKRIETQWQALATTDSLTQLPNRHAFMTSLAAELARLQRDSTRMAAVLMLDLDYFKSINDRWGHATGDAALRHFASLLRRQLRQADVAGRMGGEEFAVILHGADTAAAAAFARRLQESLETTPLQPEGQGPIALTVSIGIAAMYASDGTPELALSRSDQALYRAKAAGRNCIEIG
ncbi:diguanylate cyclase [Imbroritus primus]|uniref:Diguanylate cyclase n=1 Tax=Imbroritus primus TaxID=3058603 RepID=A0ACD3SM39_9BURK|nr:diguanylate cyclase [Burkholderiaceae bacterium PBA]